MHSSTMNWSSFSQMTFAFTVTAPADWQVVSNQPTPEPDPAGLGNATWRFAPTERISSYITALVVGPYHRVDGEYRDGDRSVPLSVYCRASLAPYLDADVILEETCQGFAFFEDAFATTAAKWNQSLRTPFHVTVGQ